MANYYYLVSSLPMLSLDQDLPMPYSSFLSMCKSSMSQSDYEEISKAKLSPEKGAKNHLMRKWEDYLTSVSSTLKEERSRKLGWEFEKGEYVADQTLKQRIHEAVFNKNPLDGEMEILALYFDFLDENTPFDGFSLEALMIYALKMQIIERVRAFSQEKGRAEFRTLYGRIQEQFS